MVVDRPWSRTSRRRAGWCAGSDARGGRSVSQGRSERARTMVRCERRARDRDRPLCCALVRNPFVSPLWQNHAFVRVWGAASISIFGSLITRIALPLRRDPHARCRTDRGRHPAQHRPRRGAVRRSRRRGMGRPAAAAAGPHLGGPGTRRAARIDPALVRAGDAGAVAAHRGRGAGRGADDLLRRGRQRVPADDRRARAPRRGQQRARRERVGRGVRRVRHQRLPGPAPQRADHDPHRRGHVPRLGGVAADGPPARAAAATALGARARARRDPAWTSTRPRRPGPAGVRRRPDADVDAVGRVRGHVVPVRARRPADQPGARRRDRRGRRRVVVHRGARGDEVDEALGRRAGGDRRDAAGRARQPADPARAGGPSTGGDRVPRVAAAGGRLGHHGLRRHRDIRPAVPRRRPRAGPGDVDVPGGIGRGAAGRDDRRRAAGRGHRLAADVVPRPARRAARRCASCTGRRCATCASCR